jgi:hypothetical protein
VKRLILEEARHFRGQLKLRLKESGIPFEAVGKEFKAVMSADWAKDTSYAVRLKDFGRFYGQNSGDVYDREQSNGETLWIIIRPDERGVPGLITFFFRRRDQPAVAERMNVNKIVTADFLLKNPNWSGK